MAIDRSLLDMILACPTCKAALHLPERGDVTCASCQARYPALPHSWEFVPSQWRKSSPLWETWDELQSNGVVSYNADPTRNLGVGKRADYLAFGEFCGFDGRVLDVGCGPQPWPTHFEVHKPGTQFVGIDPLVGDSPADYTQLRAMGEWLPFREGVFDHVVFATSLDHFIDHAAPLREARRVLRPGGTIDIWLGEKSPGAPRPQTSPEWYSRLRTPPGAQDPFHLKRPSIDEFLEDVRTVGLRVRKSKIVPVDAWRKNGYFRLE